MKRRAGVQIDSSDNLPAPEVIAAEIAEDLRTALEQFEAIQADLVKTGGEVVAAL